MSSVNKKTQVIEYTLNRKTLSAIEQRLLALYIQATRRDESNGTTIL